MSSSSTVRNHYPQDIESSIEGSHPTIRARGGAAFSLDVDGVERLVVVQEVGPDHRNYDLEEIAAAIRDAVFANHEITPHTVLLMQTGRIPKTSSGKIQRVACREAFVAGELKSLHESTIAAHAVEESDSPPAPTWNPNAGEIQAWIAQRVAALVGAKSSAIDVRAPFTSFGLDSVKLVGVSGELEDWLGRSVSPTLLFNFPTIETLANHLGEDVASTAASDPSLLLQDEPVAIVGVGCRFPRRRERPSVLAFVGGRRGSDR